MGFFSKKKEENNDFNKSFIRAVIVAGLTTIGSDSAVSDSELDMINTMLKNKGVPPSYVNSILSEVTPRLGNMEDRKKILKETSPFLTLEEKQEIIKLCTRLAVSDNNIDENEIQTIKKIAEIWDISERSSGFIIKNEIQKFT
jgi:uncharacterized tellurite resistance protein B-like protein